MNSECHEKLAANLSECFERISQLQTENHERVTDLEKRNKKALDELQDTLEAQRIEKDAAIRALNDQKEEQRKVLNAQIDDLEVQIKKMKLEVIEMRGKVATMETELARLHDVEKQLETQKNRNQDLDQQKEILQNEQLTASDYILEIEHKLYKANKTSLELIKLLKEAEGEIEKLKMDVELALRENIELKQKFALYIPVKGDFIDQRVADYINNFADRQRLRIMFQRESEGIYIYGTKRVNIRVDNNNINVRVGGGYLSIDEFIDQYTPSELERMAR